MPYKVKYRINGACVESARTSIQTYTSADTLRQAVTMAEPLFAWRMRQPAYIRDIWIEGPESQIEGGVKMVLITTPCPECGRDLEVAIDDSCGPPDEAGGECANCGALPVFRVEVTVTYELGDFLYDEKSRQIEGGLPCPS